MKWQMTLCPNAVVNQVVGLKVTTIVPRFVSFQNDLESAKNSGAERVSTGLYSIIQIAIQPRPNKQRLELLSQQTFILLIYLDKTCLPTVI